MAPNVKVPANSKVPPCQQRNSTFHDVFSLYVTIRASASRPIPEECTRKGRPGPFFLQYIVGLPIWRTAQLLTRLEVLFNFSASPALSMAMTTVQTPRAQFSPTTMQILSPASPGTWRHPRFTEIIARQSKSVFSEHNLKRAVANAVALISSFWFRSRVYHALVSFPFFRAVRSLQWLQPLVANLFTEPTSCSPPLASPITQRSPSTPFQSSASIFSIASSMR